jgi:hypothetical protein
VHNQTHPESSPGSIERHLYSIDKGPKMLPRL